MSIHPSFFHLLYGELYSRLETALKKVSTQAAQYEHQMKDMEVSRLHYAPVTDNGHAAVKAR
jgi:hypothetical protein